MKNIKHLLIGALLTAILFSTTAFAGAESGFYLGGGGGNSNIKGQVNEHNYDSQATGYKLFAGYNFGLVPLIDLAIEGAYVDMGEETTGDVTYSQTSFNGFGLLGLSFGPFGIFGKAGLAAWDANTSIAGLNSSETGSDPVYGIGARLQIARFSARVEYELYDQGNFNDVSMTSLSLLYTF